MTFEEFLQDKFIDTHPYVLKDDLGDAFNEWELDQDEMQDYGEEYGKLQFVAGQQKNIQQNI